MLKADAIKFFGSAPKLGAVLGITRQAIYLWPEEVPERWQFQIHHLTGGQLPLSPHLAGRPVQQPAQ